MQNEIFNLIHDLDNTVKCEGTLNIRTYIESDAVVDDSAIYSLMSDTPSHVDYNDKNILSIYFYNDNFVIINLNDFNVVKDMEEDDDTISSYDLLSVNKNIFIECVYDKESTFLD